jgi:hypothetical protein
MSTADYEYWWQKSGRFNIDLYNHFLRAKRDEEFQSNLQSQGCQVDHPTENNSSQQSRGCNQKDGLVASVNFKS